MAPGHVATRLRAFKPPAKGAKTIALTPTQIAYREHRRVFGDELADVAAKIAPIVAAVRSTRRDAVLRMVAELIDAAESECVVRRTIASRVKRERKAQAA